MDILGMEGLRISRKCKVRRGWDRHTYKSDIRWLQIPYHYYITLISFPYRNTII